MPTKTPKTAPKLVAPAKTPKTTSSKVRKLPAGRKQYVLDTNVLLHDPTALFSFQEHDVIVPMVVLEELDRHKKGVVDIARNARQVTRIIDVLLPHGSMQEGFSLAEESHGVATGRLYFRESDSTDGVKSLEAEKADNEILACARGLLKSGGNAILVTKDINLRVKAMACAVPAQDYRTDRVFSDEDVLPTGFLRIDESFWASNQPAGSEYGFKRKAGQQTARVQASLPLNSFLVEEQTNGTERLWRVTEKSAEGSTLTLVVAPKDSLLKARNGEQVMAMDLLYDLDVDAVSLVGPAGTGKTLLAVACGLEQVKAGLYKEVMVTRATVPLGDDIGFLPGTEQDKMDPWIGGTLRDVFEVLALPEAPDAKAIKGHPSSTDLRSKVEVASMSFMRGRSFQDKFIIIDEAQNLTARQMRALLTRAGDGCKVVLTGNLAQIDTPYLDEGSSGLAWAVKNLQDWQHSGHLILTRGERSRLASYVEEVASQNDESIH